MAADNVPAVLILAACSPVPVVGQTMDKFTVAPDGIVAVNFTPPVLEQLN